MGKSPGKIRLDVCSERISEENSNTEAEMNTSSERGKVERDCDRGENLLKSTKDKVCTLPVIVPLRFWPAPVCPYTIPAGFVPAVSGVERTCRRVKPTRKTHRRVVLGRS